MRPLAPLLSALLLCAARPVLATPAPDGPTDTHPILAAIAKDVSAERLHATIARLVGFGTRHTASDTTSPTRGIG